MKAASRQAGSARNFGRPTAATSIAKTAPASGVPKTAPKPAAIPAIKRIRSAPASSAKCRATPLAMLPPICTAVPSRPAEPPQRWVARVPSSTSGAIRRGTPPPGSWMRSRIRLLPPSDSPPCRW